MKFFSKKRVYLDFAASAPVLPAAMDAFKKSLPQFGNPSSPHEEGRLAKKSLEKSRSSIAKLAGVKPRNVVFTSGATEANTLAIVGRIEKLHEVGTPYEGLQVLYLPTAHASVVETVFSLAKRGVAIDPLPLRDGSIDLDTLPALLRAETVLVVLDAVCGETGTRFDVRGVRNVLDGYSKQIAIHVDASQLPLVESFDRLRLSADTLTLDVQKVGGVRGIGALIVGDIRSLAPVTHGGGQEEGLRAGTEAVALAESFAIALEHTALHRDAFAKRAVSMREECIKEIIQQVPQAHILSPKKVAPHILNISFPGIDTDYGVMLLDAKGFAVSTKSACETESKGSRAVALLTGDEERAKSTLRISWGPSTSKSELRSFVRELVNVIAFLDEQRS